MEWIDMLAAAGGGVLGLLFFGGLWLTVRKSLDSKQPWLWFLSSMLLRSAATVSGFVFIAGNSPRRLIMSTAGFIAVKLVMIRLNRPTVRHGSEKDGEPCT